MSSDQLQKPVVKIYGEVTNKREGSRSKSPTYVTMNVKTSIGPSNYHSANPQVLPKSSLIHERRQSHASSQGSRQTRSSKEESQYILRSQTQYSDQDQVSSNVPGIKNLNNSGLLREKSLEFTKGARNLLNILQNTDEKDEKAKSQNTLSHTQFTRHSEASQPITEDTYYERVKEITQTIQRSPQSMKKVPKSQQSPLDNPNQPNSLYKSEMPYKDKIEDKLEQKMYDTKKRKQLLEEKIAEFENKILNTNRDEEDSDLE